MKKKPIRAEDMYPDNVDVHIFNGVEARKGTVSAIIANIDILESENATDAEKNAALEQIKSYVPVMIATGLHQKVIWKNLLVQKLLDETLLSD